MNNSLAGATIVTPDLDAAVEAYATFLGYRINRSDRVDAERAAAWRAPSAAGARMAELLPESGEPRFLRLVEGAPDPGFRPFTTPGWAAAEIVVADVDALAAQLADSPFTIIGPPAVLDFDFTDRIKAMQVLGPGGEALYLTQIDGDVPGFALPQARSFVGQLFIMVMAAGTIEEGLSALAPLAGAHGPMIEARIEVLSDAFSLPRETRHKLTTIGLTEESYVEIDALPPGCGRRPASSIGLPCGIAFATFRCGDDHIDVFI